MPSTFEFFGCAVENSNVDGILLGDKNATSLSFNIISTLRLHVKSGFTALQWTCSRGPRGSLTLNFEPHGILRLRTPK